MAEEYKYKIIVEVIARHTVDNKIEPLQLVWEDGRTYDIQKIIEVKRAASLKAGGFGLRYLVRIEGKERFLFLENMTTDPLEGLHWFVENKNPPPRNWELK